MISDISIKSTAAHNPSQGMFTAFIGAFFFAIMEISILVLRSKERNWCTRLPRRIHSHLNFSLYMLLRDTERNGRGISRFSISGIFLFPLVPIQLNIDPSQQISRSTFSAEINLSRELWQQILWGRRNWFHRKVHARFLILGKFDGKWICSEIPCISFTLL